MKKARFLLIVMLIVAMMSLECFATISISTPYGTMIGSKSTDVFSVGNVSIRRVSATTTVENAAPNVYARVQAYVNNQIVFNTSKTETDSISATAIAGSQNYVKANVTVQGYHSVWSATYSREEHIS